MISFSNHLIRSRNSVSGKGPNFFFHIIHIKYYISKREVENKSQEKKDKAKEKDEEERVFLTVSVTLFR